MGSPEKPLSALGALGYRKYWTLAIMRYLDTAPDNPRLEGIYVPSRKRFVSSATMLIVW